MMNNLISKEETFKPLIRVVDEIKAAECVCGFIWNDDECIWCESYCPRCGRKIDWSGDKVNANVIPISWIESHISWLEGLDNGFSTLTAMNIRSMVNKWKEDNERINKEPEDAEKLQ